MLLGVLLLAGCGGSDGGASIALYHLEAHVRGPVADGEVTCPSTVVVCPYTNAESMAHGYDLAGDPALTEDDFATERAQALLDANSGQPAVMLDLTADGAKKFEELTRELARTGHARTEVQHLAVVVGDELVSWPSLDYQLYPDGLDGENGVQIAVDTVADAQRLAREIRGD